MLEQIWVIPAITFVSFWLILFFGRRLRFGGSEIGLVAVGACLVLSSIAGYQWIQRGPEPAHEPGIEESHGAEATASDGHEAEPSGHEAEPDDHAPAAEEHATIRTAVDNE